MKYLQFKVEKIQIQIIIKFSWKILKFIKFANGFFIYLYILKYIQ